MENVVNTEGSKYHISLENKKKPCSYTEIEGCPRTTCQAHVTLTSDLPKGMFQMAHLHVVENTCVTFF